MLPDEANNTHTHVPAQTCTMGQSMLLSLLFPVSLRTHRADFGSQPINDPLQHPSPSAKWEQVLQVRLLVIDLDF